MDENSRRTPTRTLGRSSNREDRASRSPMPKAGPSTAPQNDVPNSELEDKGATPTSRNAQSRRRRLRQRKSAAQKNGRNFLLFSPSTANMETETQINYSDQDFIAPPTEAPVWKWFKRFRNREYALCIECRDEIQCAQGNTEALDLHLAIHNSARALEANLQKLVDPTITINRPMKERIVTSLATVNYIPMKHFSSPDFQTLFKLSKMGTINTKIALKCVDRSYAKIQRSLSDELQLLLEQGAIFTLTADEWSSKRKIFMSITLHSTKLISSVNNHHVNLLTQFRDKRDSAGMKGALIESLKKVGVRITDIRGITTDDTAIMRRLGRELMEEVAPRVFYHQLCFAHAINIAILETLGFDPSEKKTLALHCPTPDGDERSEEGSNSEAPQEEEEDDDDDFNPSEYLEEEEDNSRIFPLLDYRFSVLLNKVRDCMMEFVLFPIRKAQLDRLVSSLELERRGDVCLDVPNHWRTTFKMLDNFLALEVAIKTLYHNDDMIYPLTEQDIDQIKSMMEPLKLAKLATDRLCNDCQTLFDADLVIQKLLVDTLSFNSLFGNILTRNICAKLHVRRKGPSILLRSIYGASSDMLDLDHIIRSYGPDFGKPLTNIDNTATHKQTIINELRKYVSEANRMIGKHDIEFFEACEIDPLFRRATSLIYRLGGEGISLSDKLFKRDVHTPRLSNISLLSALKILKAIQPTSTPAERSFDEAVQTQVNCNERMDNEAFMRKVFLRTHYQRSKPPDSITGLRAVSKQSKFKAPANLDDYSTTES